MKLSKSVQKKEGLKNVCSNSQKVLISKFLYTERSQKCVFKKMKLSKSPDIKISQHRRSQKCVFKKSPDIKISLHRRSQKCVFKK